MASGVPNAWTKDKKSGKSTTPDPLKSARGSAGIKMPDPERAMLSVPLSGSSESTLSVPDKVVSVCGF